MSKQQKQKKNQPEKKPVYKNPVDTKWGKLLVWFLIFTMVGVIILGLVLAIIEIL